MYLGGTGPPRWSSPVQRTFLVICPPLEGSKLQEESIHLIIPHNLDKEERSSLKVGMTGGYE